MKAPGQAWGEPQGSFGALSFVEFTQILSLKEKKLLGEALVSKHFSEGEILYSEGAPASCLYLIRKGEIHVRRGDITRIFERGDVLGAEEVFSQMPRWGEARVVADCTCYELSEARLSVDLPQLFVFLSRKLAQLALRLAAPLAALQPVVSKAPIADTDALLHGRLDAMGLVAVFQFMEYTSKSGIMLVEDESGQVTGEFDFDAGHVTQARFRHLNGEEAIWQILLRDIGGSFRLLDRRESIRAEGNGVNPRALPEGFAKSGFLLEALRKKDEFELLLAQMPSPTARLHPAGTPVNLSKLDDFQRPIAENIAAFVQDGPVSVGELAEKMPVNEHAFYTVLQALLQTDAFLIEDIAELASQPA
jgi:CRP-like cAMP-binding protein